MLLCIIHYIGNHPQVLFDSDLFNDYYLYNVTYKDFYKVEVLSKTFQLKFLIDISNRDQQYLSEIYNKNGTLINPIEGFVNGISGLYPIDYDNNGIYKLLAFQKIAGRYNADSLGYVQTSLGWNGQMFVPVIFKQTVSIFGTDTM